MSASLRLEVDLEFMLGQGQQGSFDVVDGRVMP